MERNDVLKVLDEMYEKEICIDDYVDVDVLPTHLVLNVGNSVYKYYYSDMLQFKLVVTYKGRTALCAEHWVEHVMNPPEKLCDMVFAEVVVTDVVDIRTWQGIVIQITIKYKE